MMPQRAVAAPTEENAKLRPGVPRENKNENVLHSCTSLLQCENSN
jgi:hypothetical protein